MTVLDASGHVAFSNLHDSIRTRATPSPMLGISNQRMHMEITVNLKLDGMFDAILNLLLGVGAMSVVLTVVLGAF